MGVRDTSLLVVSSCVCSLSRGEGRLGRDVVGHVSGVLPHEEHRILSQNTVSDSYVGIGLHHLLAMSSLHLAVTLNQMLILVKLVTMICQ